MLGTVEGPERAEAAVGGEDEGWQVWEDVTLRIQAGDLPRPNSRLGVSRIANERSELKEEKALCTGLIKEFFPEEAEMDYPVPFATGNSSWLFTDS